MRKSARISRSLRFWPWAAGWVWCLTASPWAGEQSSLAKPPQALCSECQGSGFVPTLPPRSYVWNPGGGSGHPQDAVPWKPCPACNGKLEPKTLLDAETARVASAPAKCQGWDRKLGAALVHRETRHVTLRGQAGAEELSAAAAACDKLAGHLQTLTHSTVLTLTRPDTHEIVIARDDAAFSKLIDTAFAGSEKEQRELAKRTSGCHGAKLCVSNLARLKTSPLENSALHHLGWMLIDAATRGKAPLWLKEGFGAYSEQAETKRVCIYTIDYEMNAVKFEPNWDAEIKKYAQQGKLKAWEYVFPLDLIGMKALDYLTGYSVVSYLLQRDPRRFVLFVLNIRDGKDSIRALEEAYGQKVKELQAAWGQWALNLR